MPFRAMAFCCGILVYSIKLMGADDEFEVHGRVVDQEGRPVEEVSVATNWSANGKVLKADGTPVYDLAEPEQRRMSAKQLGKMEPWYQEARTDADGQFTIKVRSWSAILVAMNAGRTHGGLATIPEPYQGKILEIRLEPLIRVHGNMVSKVPGKSARWTRVSVEATEIPNRPLASSQILMCDSFEARFDFKLPPGDYVLDVYGESDIDAKEEEFNLAVHPYPKLTLSADKLDVDLGTLQLTDRDSVPRRRRTAKERGDWHDYTEHYGEEPPDWHVTDAHGVKKDVRIADFRGKWLLIDFWGLGCAPCLSRGIPKLVELYEKHAAVRDRFAIVGVCIDWRGEITSIAELEKSLEPIEKHVWKGKKIPFPIILDSTFQTWERFGLPGLGTVVLIAPDGRLIAGDETTLDAILSEKAGEK